MKTPSGAADHVIDILAPGARRSRRRGGGGRPAGSHYGGVPESLTGQYMSGKRKIEVPKQRARRQNPVRSNSHRRARGNNLERCDPYATGRLFTCITASRSGKSTLINDTLFPTPSVS